VFEDTGKHGEVKRGHREIQFAVSPLRRCCIKTRIK